MPLRCHVHETQTPSSSSSSVGVKQGCMLVSQQTSPHPSSSSAKAPKILTKTRISCRSRFLSPSNDSKELSSATICLLKMTFIATLKVYGLFLLLLALFKFRRQQKHVPQQARKQDRNASRTKRKSGKGCYDRSRGSGLEGHKLLSNGLPVQCL